MVARRGNKFNFLVIFAAALGSWTYGFSVNIIGGVLGMPSFYSYFNLSLSSTSSTVGAIGGCYFGGGVIGAILGAWICGKLGRRLSLLVTCIIGIVGSVFMGAAVHIAMILVGRLLIGICSGAFQTIVPIYQSEISPAAQRGRMVGVHGFMVVTGAAVAVWVGLGCSFASNAQAQWRLSLSLCVVSPLLLAPLLFWLPESPRWLMERDRPEQALSILEKLHKTADDPEGILAREEYYQIRQQIQLEKQNKISFWDALKQPHMRKRMFLGFFIQFILQSSGVLVTLNYQVVLYGDLGITGWLAICLLAVYTTWCAILNYVNSLVVDRFGRVKMFIFGIAGAIFSITGFTIMVALFSGSNNKVGCGFGIFFVYLYTTFYASSLDVTSYVYCAEIFPTYMRTTGMGVSIIGFFGAALVYGQVAPTAFATIGWRYYLVFIIVPALGLPIIWKYFPETKGLSLEEISGVFGDAVAVDISHLGEKERHVFDENLTKVSTQEFILSINKEPERVIVDHLENAKALGENGH